MLLLLTLKQTRSNITSTHRKPRLRIKEMTSREDLLWRLSSLQRISTMLKLKLTSSKTTAAGQRKMTTTKSSLRSTKS